MYAGNRIALSLFGESHGSHIGITMEGVPAGITLDMNEIDFQMGRRRSVNALSTPRREPDKVEIISGITDGVTNGATITCVIQNTNTKSSDYKRELARPSHADYTAAGKYGGHNDHRGGGAFSGRLTAPLVFAGAVCKQLLSMQGVVLGTHVLRIHNVSDSSFDMVKTSKASLYRLTRMQLPLLDESVRPAMEEAISKAREEQDSVGGVLECMAIGMPPFVGGPYFERIQSKISALVFSVPAFLGLEFGMGFDATRLYGSAMNDPIYYDNDGKVKTLTNHSGGLNGGITNGMPIVLRVAVRPTPSIGKPQNTINMETGENATMQVQGRHDPCIAVRTAVVLESMTAIALYDSL